MKTELLRVKAITSCLQEFFSHPDKGEKALTKEKDIRLASDFSIAAFNMKGSWEKRTLIRMI